MSSLIPSQLKDALAFIEALQDIYVKMPQEPEWSEGMRLLLPRVIPLSPDYEGEDPVAWLIANDFDGYDLSTEKPDE